MGHYSKNIGIIGVYEKGFILENNRDHRNIIQGNRYTVTPYNIGGAESNITDTTGRSYKQYP